MSIVKYKPGSTICVDKVEELIVVSAGIIVNKLLG